MINFIKHLIDADQLNGKYDGRVATRFPPEPNGYLHIGHAKSICLNFGLAKDYGGTCNLRFDDTNPTTEEIEYIDSIIDSVKWLGFDWQDRLYYASDYFERIYQCAIELIKLGKAYVCDLNAEEIRLTRGTLTEAGKNSPYRDRSVEENLDLFARMRKGDFEDGAKVLRAKIDMASPNINLRDPTIYRIRKAHHHRTGSQWCIYPMYDFAHSLSDSFEHITHSICTLEFEDHRPLYDWFLDTLGLFHSQQIEFARLNLTYTLMSKRKLLELVESKIVDGWDDPRMPTLVGLRRRGFTPSSIRTFCEKIGVSKQESIVEMGFLEECVREDLNKIVPRAMAVLKPLRVVIDNFPDDKIEELEVFWHPNDVNLGKRKVPFSKVIYIEVDDFMESPPKEFFRLSPGQEVRLRYAYIIKCESIVKDENTGEIIELHCTYDPDTLSGSLKSNRKVKGTIHWVSAERNAKAEVRLYDRLFNVPNPGAQKDLDYKDLINANSLQILHTCPVESNLADAKVGDKFQFERLGYFCVDKDSKLSHLIFNRTVTLKDTWAKVREKI